MAFNIIRAAHAELGVRDLERSRHFYVDLLGFVETERTADALYLRGLEEQVHHSLVLRQGEPLLHHIAFRVDGEDDLAALAHLAASQALPLSLTAPEAEPGRQRALRIVDPFGFPVEFYSEMARAPSLLRRYDLYRGAHVMRIDHFNLHVPDVAAAYRWYTEQLGFRCSEYTDTDTEPRELWAAWLFRKPSVHDVALTNGYGPRLHHLGFWVADTASVLRACDILAAAGCGGAIERGPGRHGISNAFFLYLRDPDGHRIELYTSDYLTADPDQPALRWSVNDPRRQTFWGHAAPASWFEESTPVVGREGQAVPLVAPRLSHRPQHVT